MQLRKIPIILYCICKWHVLVTLARYTKIPLHDYYSMTRFLPVNKCLYVTVVAVIGLEEIFTTVTEGEVSARIGVSVLQGGLSQPVTVRLLAVGVNATGKFTYMHNI